MRPLTFEEFRLANTQRNPIGFPQCVNWEGKDWALAMIGEAGEVCNAVKKFNRDRRDSSAIASEIADVVTYCDLLAAYYGIDLEAALRSKFNEVSVRRGVPHRL